MTHSPPEVLILGASTRAAATSAIRAGFSPVRGDYFADIDVAPVTRVDLGDLDRSFLAIAQSHPGIPWFYTGGLENRPELVERVSHGRPLWGAPASVIKRVRDPILVARAFERSGLAHPRVTLSESGLPRDGSWLAKPLDSGGGRDVGRLVGNHRSAERSWYYQERIVGPCFGALFLGIGSRSILVGACRQWRGIPGSPYGYRGSLGPISPSRRVSERLTLIGEVVAREFAIPGWFGVDYILAEGLPWPIEINPRYTASIEVHERAIGISLLPAHRQACERGAIADPGRFPIVGPSLVVAKRIVYASRTIITPVIEREEYETSRPDTIADVPSAGTVLERGDPVLTVLASGPTASACRARAIELERRWLGRMVCV